MTQEATPQVLHATAIAVAGRGLLITGASGRGKSSFALELMSRGADLVSDDRVELSQTKAGVWMQAPETIRGLIEARGIGILRAEAVPGAHLAAVLDLDKTEKDRHPVPRETILMNQSFPLLHVFASPYFPAAVMQYLKAGRSER